MNLKNLVMGIAVFILTLSVVIYGVNAFYPQPEYNDFCGDVKTAEFIDTEARCIENGGVWEAYEVVPVKGDAEGYCDRDYYCRQDYNAAKEKWSMNLFIFAIPFGILIIVLGAFLFALESVGVGLMAGGVGTILYGVMSYWQYSADWARFAMSLLGLIVVIFVAYKFNDWFSGKKKVKKKKK